MQTGLILRQAAAMHVLIMMVMGSVSFCWAGEDVTLHVPRATTPPVIDGVTDDAIWQQAATCYPVRQRGVSPMFASKARLAWDDKALYIAIDCHDRDMRAIATERDSRLWELDDCFELFLFRPQEDGGHRMEFQLSPAGTLLDILHATGELEQDMRWNCPGIETAVSIKGTLNASDVDLGWSAELKIPWAGLSDYWKESPPEVGDRLFVLMLNANRDEAQPGLTTRELSFWPSSDSGRVTQRKDFAVVQLAPAPEPAVMTQGFTQFVSGQRRRFNTFHADYRGLSDYRECDSADTDATVQWLTAVTPEHPGSHVRFAFTGQAVAGSPDVSERATFELLVDGKPVIRFEPFVQKDTAWRQGSVSLAFHHRKSRWHPSGDYVLTLPAEMVRPGRKALLAVRQVDSPVRTYFLLKAWHDTAGMLERELKHSGAPVNMPDAN